MSELYLILLLTGIGVMLLRLLGDSSRVFEYPYFMSGVFAVFIVPQAFSLIRFPGKVSAAAVDDALLMTLLCFVATLVGYAMKPSRRLFQMVSRPVQSSRMLHVGAVFIACGYIFGIMMTQITVQMNAERGGMTGVGTIFIFFTSLKFPGLAIALSLLLQKVTLPRLILVFLGLVSPVGEVILGGRREPAMALGLVIFLTLYFNKRVKPPVILIYGALVFAMLSIPATGIYRDLAAKGKINEIRKLDLVENFKQYFGNESVLELRNAAAVIEGTQRFGTYRYGIDYWNQLVFRFVPAQVVGKEMKDSLMIGGSVEAMFKTNAGTAHDFASGSTLTGMGDSFKQFGWFGCLFFAALALVFRSFWAAANRPGALFAQLLYLLSCTSAMRALTHQTLDFLPGFTYQFIFLGLGYLYARERRSDAVPVRRARGGGGLLAARPGAGAAVPALELDSAASRAREAGLPALPENEKGAGEKPSADVP